MANTYVGRVWTLTDALATAITDKVKITRIEWHPSAADDDLDIQDANGKEIFKCRAMTGAPNAESVGVERREFGDRGVWFDGFNLVTIDGGTVYVYIL